MKTPRERPGLAKTRVLFLCTGNSCRSQMAEGWCRALHGDRIDAYSAGTVARGLDPRAVAVMDEAGVDISSQQSQTLQDLGDLNFDLVITVCADADRNCPRFPGTTRRIHRGFDDPPALVDDATDVEEVHRTYQRVRDEIRGFVSTLPELLRTTAS